MASILVVDDSAVDRLFAARMLEGIGVHVQTAEHGKEALERIAQRLPDAVLTDLQMPEMNGLELVEHVCQEHQSVAVILMTAFGSEEIAVKALQAGAASYVPKHNLARDLVETVKNVLAVSLAKRQTRAMLDSIRRHETQYVLDNTLEGLDVLMGHVKEQLKQMRMFTATDILRIGTAVYEAIVNAIEHGNLELDSAERDQQGVNYRRMFEQRGQESPYRNRHVYLNVELTRGGATFCVRDEGPGFDTSSLPDPSHSHNLGQTNGRGLFLIQTFMDEVRFSPTGNEITMVKRRG